MNIYLNAHLQRLRFNGMKGNLSTEDLALMPISDLKTMANTINKSLVKSDDLFVSVSPNQEKDTLRLKILLDIITVREEIIADKVTKKERDAKRKFLKDLISTKKVEQASQQSIEELEKQLEDV